MVRRRLKWTLTALQNKKEIFKFWNKHNKSTTYSTKLNLLFNEAMKFSTIFPNIGSQTEIKDVRIIFVRNYKLIYKITSDEIQVLTIWDMHRNPNELKFK